MALEKYYPTNHLWPELASFPRASTLSEISYSSVNQKTIIPVQGQITAAFFSQGVYMQCQHLVAWSPGTKPCTGLHSVPALPLMARWAQLMSPVLDEGSEDSPNGGPSASS